MSSNEAKNEAKTVKVKLLKDHNHAGMPYSADMEIDVPAHDAEWLKNLKIAEDVKASAATKSAEEK
jgi:hypothetical protein